MISEVQLTIHHWYVTLVGCQMHWNKQKDSQVILEPKRLCTFLHGIYYIIRFCTRLPGTHCIIKIRYLMTNLNLIYNCLPLSIFSRAHPNQESVEHALPINALLSSTILSSARRFSSYLIESTDDGARSSISKI